jgi:hypothetical protein
VTKVVGKIKQWNDCHANNGLTNLQTQKINKHKYLLLKKSADKDKEIRCHQPSSPAAASSFQVTQTLHSSFVAVVVALVWQWYWRWHWRWHWR